jgi:hypothetical protein
VSHARVSRVGAALDLDTPPDKVSADAGWAGIRGLVDVLACVPDPRDPRGIRHQIGAVLAVMVFAVLTGAGKFREIADRAVELPPELLAVAGCRRHRVSGGFVVPSEATMRKLAHAIDADAADARVCRWLRERAQAAVIARNAGGANDNGTGRGGDGRQGRPQHDRTRWE